MKLSDYIADFLQKKGINKVFVVSGGAAIHMIDSVARRKDISYICAQHEQHAGSQADGYARIGNRLGAVIVTSGPGATNLATSIANAYFDSIPIIFLCGQVASFRLKRSRQLRQKGFQETDIVGMFTPITKYVVRLTNPLDIRYELEKAVFLALDGRRGPVVLDIPDDFSRSDIEPAGLKTFIPPGTQKSAPEKILINQMVELRNLLENSRRPVAILGAGISLSRAKTEVVKFMEYFQIPCARTYAGADVLPSFHKLNIGTIGIAGGRSGNLALQTSDLIIAVGTRLSPNITGGKQNLFAPRAKKVMVDIDVCELDKFSGKEFLLDLAIESDIKEFFGAAKKLYRSSFPNKFNLWLEKIKTWEIRFPLCPKEYFSPKQIHPLLFIKKLSRYCLSGDVIVADTGANLCWTLQAWQTKKNQRIISAWNQTPMGYSLPAAIGASFTTKEKIICLIGDGGLMMCLQELATVNKYKIPLKIFIFNNRGHSIQKQTIETWLGGRYEAVDESSGLSFPDFAILGKAFRIKTEVIKRHEDLEKKLKKILNEKEPVLVDVRIDPLARITPMLKFGSGLEDLDPKLPRQEIEEILKITEDNNGGN